MSGRVPEHSGELVVLHVEDDPNDAFFVKHAFDKVAPTISLRAVADGDLATSYLGGLPPFEDRSKHPLPNLVLMDLKLPKRSGHEVLEWLRARAGLERLPVVILSSSTERADIERAYALGANAYVPKQGDLQGLVDLVRGLVTYATLARSS